MLIAWKLEGSQSIAETNVGARVIAIPQQTVLIGVEVGLADANVVDAAPNISVAAKADANVLFMNISSSNILSVGRYNGLAALALHAGVEREYGAVGVGDDEDRGIGMPRGFDLLSTEFDQRSACANLVAELNRVLKAVAVHRNGVEPDVDQNFCAVRRFNHNKKMPRRAY